MPMRSCLRDWQFSQPFWLSVIRFVRIGRPWGRQGALPLGGAGGRARAVDPFRGVGRPSSAVSNR